MTLDKKAKIRERKNKGRKSKDADADMNDANVPKIQIKSKAIKKT